MKRLAAILVWLLLTSATWTVTNDSSMTYANDHAAFGDFVNVSSGYYTVAPHPSAENIVYQGDNSNVPGTAFVKSSTSIYGFYWRSDPDIRATEVTFSQNIVRGKFWVNPHNGESADYALIEDNYMDLYPDNVDDAYACLRFEPLDKSTRIDGLVMNRNNIRITLPYHLTHDDTYNAMFNRLVGAQTANNSITIRDSSGWTSGAAFKSWTWRDGTTDNYHYRDTTKIVSLLGDGRCRLLPTNSGDGITRGHHNVWDHCVWINDTQPGIGGQVINGAQYGLGDNDTIRYGYVETAGDNGGFYIEASGDSAAVIGTGFYHFGTGAALNIDGTATSLYLHDNTYINEDSDPAMYFKYTTGIHSDYNIIEPDLVKPPSGSNITLAQTCTNLGLDCHSCVSYCSGDAAVPERTEATIRDGFYDLQGRRVDKPTTPGLYFHNKKRVIKLR